LMDVLNSCAKVKSGDQVFDWNNMHFKFNSSSILLLLHMSLIWNYIVIEWNMKLQGLSFSRNSFVKLKTFHKIENLVDCRLWPFLTLSACFLWYLHTLNHSYQSEYQHIISAMDHKNDCIKMGCQW
jgi:hypothetical protein